MRNDVEKNALTPAERSQRIFEQMGRRPAAAPAPVDLPGSLDDLMKQVAETFPIAAIVRALDNAAPGFRGVLKPMKAATAPGVGEVMAFGYVRQQAIKSAQTDDEITGVMVHFDRPADSVPVYLHPAPAAAPPAPQGDRLVQAALAWWEDKRPVRFTLKDHIANPIVNCVGGSEGDLAIAIAAIAAQAGEKSDGRV